jgi:hypothetical protein
MKLSLILAACAVCAAAFTSSNAGAADFTVDAITPIGSWLDTGLNLNSGTTYDFTVINPSTLWTASMGAGPDYESTANGIASTIFAPFTNPSNGYTFPYGALVGETGSTFFLIGTGPTILSGLSGELLVGFWDNPTEYGDNGGSQKLSVTALSATTPLPAALPLFAAGLGGLGLLGWRRKRKARATT